MTENDILKYMPKPVLLDGKAYIEYDKDNRKWVCCPYCFKRNFMINDDTEIKHLPWKCKGSNCKKEFEVTL